MESDRYFYACVRNLPICIVNKKKKKKTNRDKRHVHGYYVVAQYIKM